MCACACAIFENNNKKVEIKHINSRSNSEVVSSLLKYDSINGKFNWEIKYGYNYLKLNGKNITFSQHSSLNEINLKKFGVDYVLECTGKFNPREKLGLHNLGPVVHRPSKPESQPDQHHFQDIGLI